MSSKYKLEGRKFATYSNSSNGSEVSLPNYVNSCTDSGVSSSDSLLNSGKRSSDGVILDLAKLTEKVTLQDDCKEIDINARSSHDDLLYYKLSEEGGKELQTVDAGASTSAIPRTSSVFLTAIDSHPQPSDK